jgi:hypothetical protein
MTMIKSVVVSMLSSCDSARIPRTIGQHKLKCNPLHLRGAATAKRSLAAAARKGLKARRVLKATRALRARRGSRAQKARKAIRARRGLRAQKARKAIRVRPPRLHSAS